MALTRAAGRGTVRQQSREETVAAGRPADSYDVIVAGLGAMGSAALDHLAGRGARVLGIEPFDIPHGHGSSGGDTRLIRKAYFEHPDYVPLLQRAYANWAGLEQDSGERLLHRTGILYLAPPDAPLITGSLRSAEAHGLTLERLDGEDLARRFPVFRCPDGYAALLEPDAGFLLCERAVAAQVARAEARGAVVVRGERVSGWSAAGAGIRVTTPMGRYQASALVVTAGSWSGALLDGLDMTLEVTRQPLFWLRGEPAPEFELGRLPCWAVQRPDRPGLFYGFPALPESLGVRGGVKAAHHTPGEPADPDAPRRPAGPAEQDALLGALAPFVPGLRGPASDSKICLYTNSADGDFIVDRHPQYPQVVFGCGFSGHGFKFASVMGEALADLALDGASPLPIGFLRRR